LIYITGKSELPCKQSVPFRALAELHVPGAEAAIAQICSIQQIGLDVPVEQRSDRGQKMDCNCCLCSVGLNILFLDLLRKKDTITSV
jgi:hypothetical protein